MLLSKLTLKDMLEKRKDVEQELYTHTWEVCPYCEDEVMLDNVLSIQKCPSCGKMIKTCSMCEDKPCSLCPLDEEYNTSMRMCKVYLINKMVDSQYKQFIELLLTLIDESTLDERKDNWSEYEDYPKSYIIQGYFNDKEILSMRKYFYVEEIQNDI